MQLPVALGFEVAIIPVVGVRQPLVFFIVLPHGDRGWVGGCE